VAKAARNRQIAREKIAQQRREEARRARRRNLITGIGGGVLAAGAVAGIIIAVNSGHGSGPSHHNTPRLKLAALSTLGTLKPAPNPGPAGGEGVAIPAATPLASTSTDVPGTPVDAIRCQGNEQLLFHIHAHLTVFVNGLPRQIPAGIGIPSGRNCLYWLHTHYPDGIVHIEAPVQRVFTLGDFFDEWGQPLGPNQLGPYTGHVTAIYNGKAYIGNPRDIPLNSRAQIQLELGSPLVAPEQITFPGGL
jgi:hypothetical protein